MLTDTDARDMDCLLENEREVLGYWRQRWSFAVEVMEVEVDGVEVRLKEEVKIRLVMSYIENLTMQVLELKKEIWFKRLFWATNKISSGI